MNINILISILIFIILFLFVNLIISKKKIKTKNIAIEQINKELETENQKLTNQNNSLSMSLNQLQSDLADTRIEKTKIDTEVISLKNTYDTVSNNIKIETDNLEKLKNTINETLNSQKEISKQAYEEYCKVLEKQKEERDKEYNDLINKLEDIYTDRQLKLLAETDVIQADLDKLKSSRAAAIEAQLREKKIEENKDDFRLNLDGKALGDIKILKSIQNQISNPIVIDKIIWSNYYQPLAKIKFPKILGKPECCGIYKLTSLVTGEIYIGQSKTICDRFKEHCKNALGVGTSTAKNKLYLAIQRDGLENYTFELLEECEEKLLNEKEKHYIELYNSYNFGLNSTKGNG